MSRLSTPVASLLAIAVAMPATAAEGADVDPAPIDPATADDPFAEYGESMHTREFGGLRWGAYGELHYNNFMGGGKETILDLHRLVFLGEYTFTDEISFFTELEIEHAFIEGGSSSGEFETEQAYIDFALHEHANVKAGVLLVPISIMNLYHEPPLFHGVERPVTQNRVIPTTWWDAGVAVYGDITDELSYEVALQASMTNDGFDSDGIRGGRQKAFKSKAEDLMLTARVDYRPMPGLWLAAGALTGNTGNTADDSAPDGNLSIYTLEGRYRWRELSVGLSWAHGFIGDADELSAANGSTVPESFYGLETFVAYDFAPLIGDAPSWSLEPFVRFELIDTQAEVPDGFAEDESQTGHVLTFGITYKPIERIAIKADYQDFENDADTDVDQFNLGIGWMF